ncbi:MAG TPA: PEP-CTERM sorting domain-containing protein [Phycisphaerae bacterium]|nr:PEP-CTERM sorting domain-containing protein [Phycisphaerae bacterium]
MISSAAVATLVLSCPSTATATVVTFAQFDQSSSGNPFYYDDVPSAGDAELITSNGVISNGTYTVISIPVSFTFLVPMPADLTGPQQATLKLISSTESKVYDPWSPTYASGSYSSQQFLGNGALADILTVTRDTAAAEGTGNKTNLLTMDYTGQIAGKISSVTPQLSGNTVLGNTVTYTSDFMNFANSTQQDFSLTFSSWTTLNGGGGLQVDTEDQYYDSAYAAGAATFDVQATVPEPGTLSLATFGLAGILLRRKQKIKSPQ